MPFKTQTLRIDGVETVVRVIGQGPALVALHGAATLEGQAFAGALAREFRVFLPFHPGFGDSARAPHLCVMQDLVVHTLDLLDALGLQKPHLMGHSMGGWLAAELAVVAGHRFDRRVLNAPAGLNDPAFAATDLAAVPPQALPGYLAHDPAVARRYFPGGSECPAADVFAAACAKERAARANILKVHGFGHPNLGRWIRRIRNETLVLWGAQDRMLPAGQAPVWAGRIPGARLHLVADAGHLPCRTSPPVWPPSPISSANAR